VDTEIGEGDVKHRVHKSIHNVVIKQTFKYLVFIHSLAKCMKLTCNREVLSFFCLSICMNVGRMGYAKLVQFTLFCSILV